MKKFLLASAIVVVGGVVFLAASSALVTHGGTCTTAGNAGAMHGKSDTHGPSQTHVQSGFLKPYFEMRAALAKDSVEGLQKLSKSLAAETGKSRAALAAGPKDESRPEQVSALRDIEKAALSMKADNLEVARKGFKKLSRAVLAYVEQYGCEGTAYSFYCDMAKEGWLQETNKIGNPYYGSQMLKCGAMTGHTMNGRYMTK